MDFLAAVGGENTGKVESPKIRYGHEGRGIKDQLPRQIAAQHG